MSNSNVDQAVDIIRERVRMPAFFEKLARDWNIHPQTQADANVLMEMAADLRAANVRDQVKQASAANPFLSNALSGLKQALGQEGYTNHSNASQDALLKEAAANQVCEDEVLANAALQYAAHLHSIGG